MTIMQVIRPFLHIYWYVWYKYLRLSRHVHGLMLDFGLFRRAFRGTIIFRGACIKKLPILTLRVRVSGEDALD